MKTNFLKIIVAFMLLAGPQQVLAQADPNDIHMDKNFWSIKFFQGTRLLRPKEVLHIMESNEAAHAAFKKAMGNYNASMVFSFAGGFLVGWPVGTAIAGGDPQWGLAAAGVGLILVSIPFTSGFTKNANIAIDIYNKDSAKSYSPKLYIGFRGAGVGATLKF
jgi:hypothetical protein